VELSAKRIQSRRGEKIPIRPAQSKPVLIVRALKNNNSNRLCSINYSALCSSVCAAAGWEREKEAENDLCLIHEETCSKIYGAARLVNNRSDK